MASLICASCWQSSHLACHKQQKKTWKLWSLLRLQRSIRVLHFFICLNQTKHCTFSQCQSPCFTYTVLESVAKSFHRAYGNKNRTWNMCPFKRHHPTSWQICDIWPSSLFFSASKNQKKKDSNHFNHISYHFKEEIVLCIESKIHSKGFPLTFCCPTMSTIHRL